MKFASSGVGNPGRPPDRTGGLPEICLLQPPAEALPLPRRTGDGYNKYAGLTLEEK